MYVVLTLLSLLPILVAVQVLRIYLTEGKELRAQGERQASSFVAIPAMRGAVLDRAGRTLALNTARYDLALDPTVAGFTTQQSSFFERLSKLTGHSAASFHRKLKQRSSPKYVLLERGLSEAQKEQIETWGVPGLLMYPRFARRYNYGSTAAHLLGHVGADGEGLAGLELQYDAYLRGEAGKRAVKRDRRGVIKAFVGGKVVEPKHGETVVLTIDLIRQTILEEELERGMERSGARWGTAIAMDPATGAILAMAGAPTYNPNRAAAFGENARRNRAVTDRIEPGSTFKLVTAIAAVEQGIIGLDDSVATGAGWMVVHGHTLKDSHAYGTISFADVIALSSNIGMAKVAMKMEKGVFYQYARNLGFGQPTWIDVPGEESGLLRKPAEWSGSTLSSMSRGYGVAVTPLQMLTAYAALANGGLLVQPFVVAERRDVTGRTIWTARQDSVRRAFKRETAEKLRPAFVKVVEDGTAKTAQVEGLPIAGKTGTALKAVGGSYSRGRARASFAGFFPADDPKVVLLVVLDEPRTSIYGGAVAAPIFQKIAERWIGTFPEIAARVAPMDDLPKREAVAVPEVAGKPAAVATNLLLAEGLRVAQPATTSDGASVVAQAPTAKTSLVPTAQVQLTLAEGKGEEKMPDLTGLSARDAVFWLQAQGVKVKQEGRGKVTRQSDPPGGPLPKYVTIVCR